MIPKNWLLYDCVSAYAKLLGEDQAVSLLRQTFEEEKATDKKLTQLSEQINVEAADSEETDGADGQWKKPATTKAKAARA